jgi:hypothetical protein
LEDHGPARNQGSPFIYEHGITNSGLPNLRLPRNGLTRKYCLHVCGREARNFTTLRSDEIPLDLAGL